MENRDDDYSHEEGVAVVPDSLASVASSARLSIVPSQGEPQSASSQPGKVELIFDSVPTLPLLELPKGSVTCVNGKYDYSIAADKPFSINVPEGQEQNDFQVNVEPDDFLNGIPEPEMGIFPEEFDREKLEKMANSIGCAEYVPYVFKSIVAPLRPPDKIADVEKCEDIHQITAKKKTLDMGTTFIKITDTKLSPKMLKSLGKYISQYSNLNVLILRSLQLQKLEDFVLPKLQYVDLAHNLIKTVKSCLSMFKHSPFLEVVKLQHNPVTAKVTYRPKLIGNCGLFLRALDDKKVEISERIEAMLEYGPKNVKQTVGQIRWDLCFAATPDVKAMKAWHPSQLVMLVISKQNLTYFNVGTLVNLEYLDLSRNSIKEIRGMGLEKCQALQHLNLKQNLIYKRESLKVLGFLPCLQYLMLKGNPVTQAPDYRLTITFETRFLRGSNRTTGLVELDEVPITIDERIAALKVNKTSIPIDKWRWRYVLMQSFGHMQIKSPEIVSKIKTVSFPKCKLNYVDISGFTSLEYLDLSKNNLKEIVGLENLSKLRLLNLADNPKLKWKAVLSKLKSTTTLEKVNLYVSAEGHPRKPDNKKYRGLVLKELLANLDLYSVDEIPVTPNERVETYRSMKGVTNDKAERYRFMLAVVLDVTPPTNRKYYPAAVGPGTQYDPLKVTSLYRLRGMSITFADFKPFVNLEEINLSQNKLTDITNIGIEELPKLKVLDVSFNQIGGTLKALASFLDKLVTLECFGIRGNPVVKNFPEDRKRLISLMSSMKEVTCRLQVIDIQISISERIEAWKKASTIKKGLTLRKSMSLSTDQIERFRMEAILFQRIPSRIAASQIKTLDLSECALPSFDVAKFSSLEILLMRKNDIHTMGDINGLTTLKLLRVLDLRDNCFGKLEEFVDIVNLIPSLVSIGMRGNKCASSKDYRIKFLTLLPQLHESRFTLSVIDNEPIGIEEICSVWKAPKNMTAHEKFFHVLILRKTPDIPLGQVKELDLAFCGLTNMDLSKFTGLEKLSLRGNSIDANNLLKSQITQLQRLSALDVSDNNVCDFSSLITVAKGLTRLEYFSCTGNPCFPNNEPLLRINIIAKLPYMKQVDAALKYLNGFEITITERGQAFEREPNFDLENFRMDLLFAKIKVNERDMNRVLQIQQLDINNFELTSLRRIRPFANLAFLNASHNNLKTLEEDVFLNLPCLTYLDLQHNEIEDKGAKLLAIFSRMPALKALFIRKSTKDKTKTNKPKQYLRRVCSVVRQIEILDGIPNPFLMHGPGGSGVMGQVMLPHAAENLPMPVAPEMLGAPMNQVMFAPGSPFVSPTGYIPHMQPASENVGYAGYSSIPWLEKDSPAPDAPPLSPINPAYVPEPAASILPNHDDGSISSESSQDESEESDDSDESDESDEEVEETEVANEEDKFPELAGLSGVSIRTLRIKAVDSNSSTESIDERNETQNPYNARKTIRSSSVSVMRAPTLKKVQRLSSDESESEIGEEDANLDESDDDNGESHDSDSEGDEHPSEHSDSEEVQEGRLWEPEKEIARLSDADDPEQKSFKESMRQKATSVGGSEKVPQEGGKAKKESEVNSRKTSDSSSTDSDAENVEEIKDDAYWESDEDEMSDIEDKPSGIRAKARPSAPASSTLRRLASEISMDVLADYG